MSCKWPWGDEACWDYEKCDCVNPIPTHCMFCGKTPGEHPRISVWLDSWFNRGHRPYWLYKWCRLAWVEWNLR